MTSKVRLSPFMVALAVVTLVLSSWGLYGLAHDYAHMPAVLAAVVVGGFDLFAVAAGQHALHVARDGDSPLFWNAVVVAAAGLSAVMQYGHILLSGGPVLVGVMMAALPVATVCLFEGTLRRAYRLAGRIDGRVAQPRATFEPLLWVLFPGRTMRAFRVAVLDRTLSADSAFKLAMLAERDARAVAPPQPVRREIALSYEDITAGRTLDMPALTADVPDMPADIPGLHTVPSGRRGDLTAAVRAAHATHGDNLPAVLAAVRASGLSAADETVRRTLSRLVSGQNTG